MGDFIYDNLEKIIVGIGGILLIALLFYVGWYEAAHCLKGHYEDVYYAPTYMKVGDNMMMPVGGGMSKDFVCDKWK